MRLLFETCRYFLDEANKWLKELAEAGTLLSAHFDTTEYKRLIATIPSLGATLEVGASAFDGRAVIVCTKADPASGEPLEISTMPDTDRLYEDERGIWVFTCGDARQIDGTEDMGKWRAAGGPLPADLMQVASTVRPLIEAAHEAEMIRKRAEKAKASPKGSTASPALAAIPAPTLSTGRTDLINAVVVALNAP